MTRVFNSEVTLFNSEVTSIAVRLIGAASGFLSKSTVRLHSR
jgi:hypothetical protein